MGQPVTVVAVTPEPEGTPSADFQAGAASIVAAAAADVATESAQVADAAHTEAEAALTAAVDAEITAMSADANADFAHERIDRIEGFLTDMVDMINSGAAAGGEPPTVDDGAPPPVTEPIPDPPDTSEGKPGRIKPERHPFAGRKTRDLWFGDRA